MTHLSKLPKTLASQTCDLSSGFSANIPNLADLLDFLKSLPLSLPQNHCHTSHAITLAEFDELPDSANVRERTVRMLFGNISRSTIWRNAGKSIPAPRKLTPGVTSWNVGELRQALGIRSCIPAEYKTEDATNTSLAHTSPARVCKGTAAPEHSLIEPSSARSVKGDHDE